MISFPIFDEDSIFCNKIRNISVLGTVHDYRNRWNPFEPENELTRSSQPTEWVKWLKLSSRGGRHRDGVYSFRFVINHNPRRLLKLDSWNTRSTSEEIHEGNNLISASLCESDLGKNGQNITIHVHHDCEACLVVDSNQKTIEIVCDIAGAISYVNHVSSVQINGFIWDDLDMFAKFNEHSPGRDLHRISDKVWERELPLTTKGGIDFRADGVYQFLLSANGDEDQGYGALNRQNNTQSIIDLVSGTGFGSSHGTSYHSGATIRVLEDDVYTFTVNLERGREQVQIRGKTTGRVQVVNNEAHGMQLLGDIHPADSFDPTKPQSQMHAIDQAKECFEKLISLEPGYYSINFAIGSELFLDTMALGCWLKTNGTSLKGIGWHGKPNECNINFRVLHKGIYRFSYNRSNDIFSIEACDSTGVHPACLEATTSISALSIVGNFTSPLVAWDPKADENLMVSLGRGRFEKIITLEQGVDYQFKFVGNQSNWQIVFADYELDGYGLAYMTNNPDPYNSRLEDLRVHGHLTTHGNPPPLHFISPASGPFRIMVDLWTGAYGIKSI